MSRAANTKSLKCFPFKNGRMEECPFTSFHHQPAECAQSSVDTSDINQLLQLCLVLIIWSDPVPVNRPVLDCSGKFTTCMVTSEKLRKSD